MKNYHIFDKNFITKEESDNNNVSKPNEHVEHFKDQFYQTIKENLFDRTKNIQGNLKCVTPCSIQLFRSMTKEEIRKALGSSQEDKEIEEIIDYIYKELNKNNEEKI